MTDLGGTAGAMPDVKVEVEKTSSDGTAASV